MSAETTNNTTTQVTPKLSINDLKYIVMEGGGARGNTYLGAVRELENQLFKRVERRNPSEKIAPLTEGRQPGIMDFLSVQNGNINPFNLESEETKPIIEGVAGASAGALTTFAIVLGLNSEEIKEILDFDFSNFLSEVDAGKYRMIDENSKLKVGEDKTLYNQPDTLFETKQKTLGGKKKDFEYDLSKNKTTIRGNAFKFAKRGFLFNFLVKIIVDGVVYNAGQLFRLLSNTEKPSWFQKFIKKQLGEDGQNSKEAGANFISRMLLYSSVITTLFYTVFRRKKTGFKITANSIMGIFADRGLYSGFQVREFFLDLMIFAATKDTFFQKQLIKNYPTLSSTDFEVRDKNDKTKIIKFVIGRRGDCEFGGKFKNLIDNTLKNITFREFYHILKIDYGIAVSNFTTNSPIYFSDKYTPNFRVLEAVGASMSIPPAIRPLYNTSDVVFEPHDVNKADKETKLPISHQKNIPQELLKDGKFSRSNYELYEYATKKALQEVIEKEVYIDLNNVIELNTFLNYIQTILIGVRGNQTKTDELRNKFPHTVEVNGSNYKITIELLLFFYNAQFKGLLIDGGYFNNIPFNYFRESGNDPAKLDGVLAIKLDRSFPPDFMKQVRDVLEPLKHKEKEIIERVEREEMELGKIIPSISIDTSDFDKEFEQVVIQIQGLLQSDYLEELKKRSKREFKENKGNLNKEQKNAARDKIKSIGKNRKIVLKIIHDWYIQNGVYNEVKPWEIPRPILQIAFTGYEYGSKRGQIRDISDHNYIIPLYDYGVGTYDFDLDKVRSLANLAQEKAKEDVKVYFENR